VLPLAHLPRWPGALLSLLMIAAGILVLCRYRRLGLSG